VPRSPQTAQRSQLASRLRQLRLDAALSGEQLAARLGWTQSKISKIETAKTRPSAEDVRMWGEATRADREVINELSELAQGVHTEALNWRVSHGGGLTKRQLEMAEIEARSDVVRSFQPAVVPGLLQTGGYAREVLTYADRSGQRDVPAAVAARLERQSVLYDQEKRFEFVLTEAALWWRPGPPALLLAQLDRVLSIMTLSNVDVRIIPLNSEARSFYVNGFLLYETPDEPLVVVETYTQELLLTEPSEVDAYRQLHGRLQESAVQGAEARVLIDNIKRALAGAD
jgi:transcriptional regulator with XRE-family HTH domain